MRKILLTVMAVMLTAGAMAQTQVRISDRIEASALNGVTPVKATPVNRLPAMKAGAVKAVAKAAPQGTEKDYFLDYVDYPYGVGLSPRYHVPTKVVFADNNKVYFQNMIYTSFIEGVWIEGTLSADGSKITITNEQLLADMGNGDNVYLCKLLINETTGAVSADKENEVTLDYDKTRGTIVCQEGDILGLFTADYSGYYTLCEYLTYLPTDMFPAATEHDYSCVYETSEGKQNYSGKVKMISIEDMCYVSGLMPDYPDAWMFGTVTADGLTFGSSQVMADDLAMAFINSNYEILDEYKLLLDEASGSYKSESGYTLVNLFATQSGGLGFNTMHADIDLKKAGTAGIGNAVTGDEGKEAVSSELFDLSGRRVNGTQKGVVIKLTKYADGSSNATKMIK